MNTEVINLHIEEIFWHKGSYGTALLYQMGRHVSKELLALEKPTLLPIPVHFPELNPMEPV